MHEWIDEWMDEWMNERMKSMDQNVIISIHPVMIRPSIDECMNGLVGGWMKK